MGAAAGGRGVVWEDSLEEEASDQGPATALAHVSAHITQEKGTVAGSFLRVCFPPKGGFVQVLTPSMFKQTETLQGEWSQEKGGGERIWQALSPWGWAAAEEAGLW